MAEDTRGVFAQHLGDEIPAPVEPIAPIPMTEEEQTNTLLGQDFVNTELTPDFNTPAAEQSYEVQEKPEDVVEDPQSKYNRIKNQLSQPVGPHGRVIEPTEDEVLDEMDLQDAEDAAEEQAKVDNLKERLKARKIKLERAAAREIQVDPDAELDPLLKQMSEEINAQSPASKQEIQDAETPSKAEVQNASIDVREQNAKLVAAAEEARRMDARKQEILDTKVRRIEEDSNVMLEKFDDKELLPDMNWRTAIGLILGGMAQGGLGLAENPVMKAMQKNLDRQMEQRKFSHQQKKDAQLGLLKKMEAEAKLAQSSNPNSKAALEVQQLKQKIEAEKHRVSREAIQESMKYGVPLAEQDMTQNQLAEKDKDRYISVFDVVASASKEQVGKYMEDNLKPATEVSQGLKRLEEHFDAIDVSPGEKVNPVRRSQILVDMKMLMGKMRIPIVGPGVFQEYEQKLVMSLLPDPSRIAQFPGQERAKLALHKRILRERLKGHSALIGVHLSEAQLDKFVGPGLNSAQNAALEDFKKSNKLDTSRAIMKIRSFGAKGGKASPSERELYKRLFDPGKSL